MESNQEALIHLDKMHQAMENFRTSIQGLILISLSNDPLKTEITKDQIETLFLEVEKLGDKMKIIDTSREEVKTLVQNIKKTLMTWEPKIRRASFGEYNGTIQGALTASLEHLETIETILHSEKS